MSRPAHTAAAPASAPEAGTPAPTRRRIMKLLAAAVAVAVAGPELARRIAPAGSTTAGKARWIGHC